MHALESVVRRQGNEILYEFQHSVKHLFIAESRYFTQYMFEVCVCVEGGLIPNLCVYLSVTKFVDR